MLLPDLRLFARLHNESLKRIASTTEVPPIVIPIHRQIKTAKSEHQLRAGSATGSSAIMMFVCRGRTTLSTPYRTWPCVQMNMFTASDRPSARVRADLDAKTKRKEQTRLEQRAHLRAQNADPLVGDLHRLVPSRPVRGRALFQHALGLVGEVVQLIQRAHYRVDHHDRLAQLVARSHVLEVHCPVPPAAAVLAPIELFSVGSRAVHLVLADQHRRLRLRQARHLVDLVDCIDLRRVSERRSIP
eukprot:1507187-Rhodomonas_salina.4